jgi:predicted nucleic acid-binding protein
MHTHSFEVITDYMEQDNYELFINSDTLANLFYVLSNRSTLNAEEVLDKMRFIHEIFTLVSIESKEIEMALALCADSNSKHKDYEDAMQYVCAKKINTSLILTNDKKFVSVDIGLCATGQ